MHNSEGLRVLFISYLFQPNQEIGAVRPTNISRWLAEFGHEVTVITNNPRGAEAAGKAAVHCIEHSALVCRESKRLERRASVRRAAGVKLHGYELPTAREKKYGIFSKRGFFLFRAWAWDWTCQMDWFFRCKRYIRRHLCANYDVIISSFGPLGSFLTGRWAKRHNYGRCWISDMRDPIANISQGHITHQYSLRLEQSALREADQVITVSTGEAEHFRMLAESPAEKEKVTTIENGFERAEPQNSSPLDGILRIVYTGRIYSGRSDADALLYAALELEQAGIVPEGGIEIHYAGPDDFELMNAARRCGAERFLRNHGKLPRSEALALQEKSDILCVLSWNNEQARGHLPGKFWEYLRAGKPVLSIVSGEVPDAELSCRVREMRLGFAYEYAAGGAEDARLRAWLQEAWRCKSGGRPVPFDPDRQKVLEYRYDNRARRMEEVCLACAGKERRKKT